MLGTGLDVGRYLSFTHLNILPRKCRLPVVSSPTLARSRETWQAFALACTTEFCGLLLVADAVDVCHRREPGLDAALAQ
jgi:hypothetical protein